MDQNSYTLFRFCTNWNQFKFCNLIKKSDVEQSGLSGKLFVVVIYYECRILNMGKK